MITVTIFNSCTKCVCRPGIIHDCTPDCDLVSWAWNFCMYDLTTLRRFHLQATSVIGGAGLFFEMLSMCVCTTRRQQTSGRLVQELNVCTVHQLLASQGFTDCYTFFSCLRIFPFLYEKVAGSFSIAKCLLRAGSTPTTWWSKVFWQYGNWV